MASLADLIYNTASSTKMKSQVTLDNHLAKACKAWAWHAMSLLLLLRRQIIENPEGRNPVVNGFGWELTFLKESLTGIRVLRLNFSVKLMKSLTPKLN